MTNLKPTEAQVAKKSRRALPITTMQDLVIAGELIARTKLFGDVNPADGFIIASACYQEGETLIEFASTYNYMNGRFSKKTDAILVALYNLGGKHRIIERTSDVAKAELTYKDNVYISEVSFDALRNEPFIYAGREADVVKTIAAGQQAKLTVKAKYSTERARMQMLWARCISDGVRVVCPAACMGIYTPEEVSDFVDEPSPAVRADMEIAVPAPAPASIEICPIGQFAGQRWDEMDSSILAMAADIVDPAITAEMKSYISSILASRNEVSNG